LSVLLLIGLPLMLSQGTAAMEKGRVARARAKINRAEKLLSQGKHARAESLFSDAIAIEPEIPLAHVGLGAALVGQERFSEALLALAEAEERFVAWEHKVSMAELTKRQLADRQLQMFKDLAAEAAARPGGRELDPDAAGLPVDLGRRGEARIAKEQFIFRDRWELEGLASIPAQVFYLEGIAYLRTGRSILGIEALKVCLIVDDEHGLAHYNLAVALFGQGEIGEAEEHLARALAAGIEPHPGFVADLERAAR
jgi:tetratricopeptide (TPR) repeat protein